MIKDELIEIAVNWWVEKITSFAPHDNGALNEKASSMACMMANLGALRFAPKDDQVEKFKNSLMARIKEESLTRSKIDLYCDYGPGYILSDAAEDARINVLLFPFKTGMYITEKEVKVSNGYGQQYVVIS